MIYPRVWKDSGADDHWEFLGSACSSAFTHTQSQIQTDAVAIFVFLLLFDCVFIFVISALPGSGCWHWESWETGRVAGCRIADCIWKKSKTANRGKRQARCSDILLRQHFIANIVQFHFKRQSNFMWFLQAALLIVRQTFDFSSVSAGRFLVSFQPEKLDWKVFGFIFNVILLLSLFFHLKCFL